MSLVVKIELGVIPITSAELVEDVLVALGADSDEIVETHAGQMPLKEALSNHYEIHQASRKFVASIGNKFESVGGPSEVRGHGFWILKAS